MEGPGGGSGPPGLQFVEDRPGGPGPPPGPPHFENADKEGVQGLDLHGNLPYMGQLPHQTNISGGRKIFLFFKFLTRLSCKDSTYLKRFFRPKVYSHLALEVGLAK